MNKFMKHTIILGIVLYSVYGCTSANNAPPTEIESPPAAPQLTAKEIFSDNPSGRIPVIYSHGGGPCDIAGMVYLSKHPDVDLIGLVLTRGEIHPEKAVETWPVFLYDVMQSKDTALALGTDERMDPDSHEFPEEWRGPADNFWDLPLPVQVTEFEIAYGPNLIVELVNNSPEKVTLIGMASMIDIALAIQQDPGIIDNIRHVVIMGGAFTIPGNLDEGPEPTNNKVAEWNMYIDALAAKYLFNSGVPLSIVPLDAIQYLVSAKDVATLRTIRGPDVDYVTQQWEQQYGWSNDAGFLIWDTITATAVTNPENFHWIYDGVDVIAETGDFQGQTIALNNGAQHTRYATGADYEAVLDQLFEVFRERSSLTPSEEDPIIELAGTWEGFTGAFHITFTFSPACQLNEKCGTFEIPEFFLTGDVAFVEVDGDKYVFETYNLSSGQSFDLYEFLQTQEDGRLYYSSTGDGERSEAILYRK
jgi:inosine-uridine nucleoside N-ribohydrolase